METQGNNSHNFSNWYDKHYKILLIIPAIILLVSIFYLMSFYQQHGDLISKDVSLTGGTSITVFDQQIDSKKIQSALKVQFPDLNVRSISDIRTGKQHGFTLESQQSVETLKNSLEKELGYNLTTENSSVEFSGSSLSKGFYTQLIHAVIVAFLLMGLVVFVIFGSSRKMKLLSGIITSICVHMLFNTVALLNFLSIFGFLLGTIGYIIIITKSSNRNVTMEIIILVGVSLLLLNHTFIQSALPFISIYYLIVPLIIALIFIYTIESVPSIAVILAAFADIVMTLALVDFLGMRLSGAGIVAFLMLIGYSVDTDILLTSRLLKNKDGTINQRIFGAFTTGITMTLAAIAAVGVSLAVIYSFSETLRQIFEIILIGLFFDIINTWITNASILKWHMEANNLT